MSEVRVDMRGRTAVVTIDNPPVHALSTAVRAGLLAAVRRFEADPACDGAVIATAGPGFVAGADLREMDRPPEEPLLPAVLAAVAGAQKPIVAAIGGAALGGGFELALACRARIATQTARFGFPEVTLGLIPGAGGTQRALRLLDFPDAARLVTSGKPILAQEALRLGLVHEVVAEDTVAAAVALIESGSVLDMARFPPATAIEARSAPSPDARSIEALRRDVTKDARGQAAAPAALALLERASTLPYADGLAAERALFLELRSSREAKALRRLFLAEREAGRPPSLQGVVPRPVASLGVVGAGLMGCGIAFSALNAGLSVVIAEATDDALARGRQRMADLMDRSVKSGRLAPERPIALEAALIFTTDYAGFSSCDLVIEAVVEDLAVKRAVFERLDAVVRADCLLATNTSYLDVDAIAEATCDPSRVLGLHFFSPAHVMRLLEVVRAAKTSDETLATGVAFGRRLKKIPVITGVCEGFCGNRILKAYRIVAEAMVEDGASPAMVDRAMTAFGFPMGPFAVQDMAGLEIAYANRRLMPALRPDGRRLGLVETLVEAGRLGRKNGRGWYRYAQGAREGEADPEAKALISAYRQAAGIVPGRFVEHDIREALLAAMRAEGAAIVAEGIVARPEDVDLVMVNGYGFPAHKGGPMFEG